MSGPSAPRAAFAAGGFLAQPPVGMEKVESIIGPIGNDGWRRFIKAYEDFGWGLILLNASRANRNKNDPLGWHTLQTAVSSDLRKAIALIHRQYDAGDTPESGRRLRFMSEAAQNYSLQKGDDEGGSVHDALRDAEKALRRALTIVVRAKPLSITVASEVELRRRLVRALADACGGKQASDGRTLGQLSDGPAESDRTAFERLISELGIHISETPAALSRWVRDALSDAN